LDECLDDGAREERKRRELGLVGGFEVILQALAQLHHVGHVRLEDRVGVRTSLQAVDHVPADGPAHGGHGLDEVAKAGAELDALPFQRQRSADGQAQRVVLAWWLQDRRRRLRRVGDCFDTNGLLIARLFQETQDIVLCNAAVAARARDERGINAQLAKHAAHKGSAAAAQETLALDLHFLFATALAVSVGLLALKWFAGGHLRFLDLAGLRLARGGGMLLD
jgi:hypothetical protein